MSAGVELDAILAKLEPRGDDGVMTFVFAKGEEVPADHAAVLAFPHLFDSCADAGQCDDER
jgi:hypothetical protein